MAIVVILPKQGQSVESCIITEIKKKKGDSVKKGDVLFTYETDKATFEEESSTDGVILECFHNEGDEVPVLLNMMVIGQPGEEYSALIGVEVRGKEQEIRKEEQATVSEAEHTQPINQTTSQPINQSTNQPSAFISPRAKNLATKEAVEITQLTGSGPKGRIIEKDILSALENRPKMTSLAKQIAVQQNVQPQGSGSGLAGTAKSTDLLPVQNTVYGVDFEDKKISNMRKLIAKAMHTSLQNRSELTHHLGADARRMMELRKKVKKAMESGKLS